jgi:uncharacterized protein
MHLNLWLKCLGLKTARLLMCAFLTIFGAQTFAQELQAVPPLRALANDLTHTLSATELAQLEAKLKEFEVKSGSQVGVLMVETTGPEDIFDYAHRAANTYKLGRQGVGDGVLIVVAKNDRKMHIYVMRALEGAIPDLAAKRIVMEQMKPAFAAGQFYVGLDAATSQVFKLILGEALPAPQNDWHQQSGSDLFTSLFVLTFTAIAIGSLIARSTSRWIAAPVGGFVASFVSLNMGAGFIALMIGLIVLCAIFVFGKQYTQLATQRRSRLGADSNARQRSSDIVFGSIFGAGGFGGGNGGGSGGWSGSGGGGDAGGGGAGGDW